MSSLTNRDVLVNFSSVGVVMLRPMFFPAEKRVEVFLHFPRRNTE